MFTASRLGPIPLLQRCLSRAGARWRQKGAEEVLTEEIKEALEAADLQGRERDRER